MKFFIEEACNVPSVEGDVFMVKINFDGAGELALNGGIKWLASFRNREDAEAYKTRKEREYK